MIDPKNCAHMKIKMLACSEILSEGLRDIRGPNEVRAIGCADCLQPLSKIKPGTKGVIL